MAVYTINTEKLAFLCILGIYVTNFVSVVNGGSSGYYADNGVDQTERMHDMSTRDKRELQHEILTLLGLHQRPKPKDHSTTEYSAPRFMLNLYKSITAEDGAVLDSNEGTFHPKHNITVGNGIVQPIEGTDVIMSFVNRARKIPHLRHERDKTFYFDLSEVTSKESVIGAELRLYKEKANKWKSNLFRVEINMIKQGKDPEDKELEILSNITVPADHEGWLTLDIARAAARWTMFPQANLGLYMKIIFIKKDREVDPGKFGIVGRKGSTEKQPFMVGFFSSTQGLNVHQTRTAIRRRRAERSYREEADKYLHPSRQKRAVGRWPCQRQVLYVKFRDLGWQNWIIAPDGYYAFFCKGECAFPLGAHMNATNHAIVQTLVHLMNPYDAPSPGCAPTKLGAQSVLYFDDDSNVVLKKFSNMIVKSCGCH